MQTASIVALYQVLKRENSALLHYLSGAWPWTSAAERAAADEVQKIVDAEQAALARLATHLRRQRVVPPAASYPMTYTGLHYVALSYLLPRLVEEQAHLLAALEADLAAATPELKEVLTPFCELKKAHRARLAELAAAHAGAKSLATRR
jgi:hypothetical protein